MSVVKRVFEMSFIQTRKQATVLIDKPCQGFKKGDRVEIISAGVDHAYIERIGGGRTIYTSLKDIAIDTQDSEEKTNGSNV